MYMHLTVELCVVLDSRAVCIWYGMDGYRTSTAASLWYPHHTDLTCVAMVRCLCSDIYSSLV